MQLKKFVAVLPALALSTAMLVAQEPQPSSSQQPTQTTVGQPTDTNEPVFKGCLSGTKDNYVLTTSDGKSFRLHSDKDIAEHVGKMVEIRGTVKKEGADRPADAAPAAQTSEMDVADVKNIEGSCPADNSSAASSDMPKSDATSTQTQTTASTEQKATVTEQPAASASVTTETQPTASAEVKTETTTTEPAASAAVTTDQSNVSANQATDTTATASAGNDQKVQSDNAQLPETASPLPLLGLLGFGATGLGLLFRRK
ncbi:MAG TPA: DUF5818 domain-containing protein [Terriglobales bacterium]|nr:DUF5818 domain-containing protein [Terriglobales bacterium]